MSGGDRSARQSVPVMEVSSMSREIVSQSIGRSVPSIPVPSRSSSSPSIASTSIDSPPVASLPVHSQPLPVPHLHPLSVLDRLVSPINSIPDTPRLNA